MAPRFLELAQPGVVRLPEAERRIPIASPRHPLTAAGEPGIDRQALFAPAGPL